MDSDFDSRVCNSVDLPCEEAECYDMFNTSTSHCPKTANITVTVSTIESGVDSTLDLEPIRIGMLYHSLLKLKIFL